MSFSKSYRSPKSNQNQKEEEEESEKGGEASPNLPLAASCLLSLSVVGPASGTGASGLYSEANCGRV